MVNQRLKELIAAAGIETASLECFNILEFGGPGRKSEADIIALSDKAVAQAPDAEGILISCGGLHTLGVAKPLEERHGIPVVSSTPAAFWAAMRLVGESGQVAGVAGCWSGRGPCALGSLARRIAEQSTADSR